MASPARLRETIRWIIGIGLAAAAGIPAVMAHSFHWH
jgi:hypothetical protein